MSIGGSGPRDRGASFIELLVSVVILGTSGLAVLTTVSVTARGAAEQRQISDAQSWLATIGDAVTDVDSYYRDCDSQPDPSIIAAEYETNIVAPKRVGVFICSDHRRRRRRFLELVHRHVRLLVSVPVRRRSSAAGHAADHGRRRHPQALGRQTPERHTDRRYPAAATNTRRRLGRARTEPRSTMTRRSRSRHLDRSGDAGVTLVEVLITTGVLALMATVIGATVTTIFRNESGIADVVSESHDIQQAVNYFHLDIESGPATTGDYKWTSARGTGCSDSGDGNVLQFDTDTDGVPGADRRVAYLLTSGPSAGLDRYECEWNGSGWTESSVINIADRLDNTSGNAVTVDVTATAGVVDLVEMTFAQSNADRLFAAAPRAETGLAAVGIGTCTSDVLSAVLGFGGFVEGDVSLNSGDVEGSLAVGGSFGWNGNDRTVGDRDANNTNGFPNVTFYAQSIDWASSGSAGPLVASDDSSKNIVLTVPPYVVVQGIPDRVYESSPVSDPHIEIDRNADVFDTGTYPLDFTTQFDTLRACSEAMANLPAGADAGHAGVSGTPNNLHVTPPASGATAVLNIPEAYLSGVTQITDGLPLSNPNPLIVNISENPNDVDDDIVFDIATPSWTTFGDYKRVLYNFTNMEGTITVAQDVYGTIFAPFASVVTNPGVDVHGAVIATTWTHNGGAVVNDNLKLFNATINWD